MKQSAEIEQWKSECTAFEKWFSDLGGNIGNNEEMSEAFRRIEAKNVSDNRLYELLEPKSKLTACDIKLSEEFTGFM